MRMREDLNPTPRLCSVTITRKQQLMDKQLPMEIFINGQRVGWLRNGETATFPLYDDTAEIQAVIAFGRSGRFRPVADHEGNAHFFVKNGMTDAIFIVGAALVFVSLGMLIWTDQLIWALVALPAAAYHLWLRRFKKGGYLTLQQVPPGPAKESSAADPVEQVL